MTTPDLKQIEKLLDKKLENVASKDDIKDVILKMDKLEVHLFETFNKNKADIRDLENLEERIAKIEEGFQTS